MKLANGINESAVEVDNFVIANKGYHNNTKKKNTTSIIYKTILSFPEHAREIIPFTTF